MIADIYKTTLSKIKPYVFSFKKNFQYFDLNPLDTKIESQHQYDCSQTKSEDFFNLILKVDQLAFGEQDMGMDRWVLYDCSAMPGAIFGFGINPSEVPENLKQKMQIPEDYTGLIPISMYITIPTVEPGHWFGHNLSSLNNDLGGVYPGLGLLTKALGLVSLKITKQYGATQWNNPAINIHSQLSPLNLISSYTPIHTHKFTFSYYAEYSIQSIINALSGKKREIEDKLIKFELDGSDHTKIIELQKKIEFGENFTIAARPINKNNKIYYPIT